MMKTLGILLLVVSIGSAACAVMPLQKPATHISVPFQIGVDEDHHLYPEEYGVHGLRLNVFYVENRFMKGLDIGFWNVAHDAGGLQMALYRNDTHDFGGIQLSLWSAESKQTDGFQISLVQNDAGDVRGLQLTGLLGAAGAVSGFQIAGLSAVSGSLSGEAPMKGLQAGLFEARAENAGGLQLGGVLADTDHQIDGLQLGVLFADARHARGLQLAGLAAKAKEAGGLQLGGLMAQAELDFHGLLQAGLLLAESGDMGPGLQFGGLAATTVGRADGLQLSLLGTAAGVLSGIELAGLWNFVYEDAAGAQIALGYNRARNMSGLQIGLINQCDDLNGVQIGLINTVRNSDVRTLPLLQARF